jgi:hypothetical protein
MPRRCEVRELAVRHSWVWTADAERRWVRAVRLLLDAGRAQVNPTEEEGHGTTSSSLGAGVDRTPGEDRNQ